MFQVFARQFFFGELLAEKNQFSGFLESKG